MRLVEIGTFVNDLPTWHMTVVRQVTGQNTYTYYTMPEPYQHNYVNGEGA